MKLNKRNLKSNKAITLIALVITIIVLLILAGVAIATLTGDNGLLQKSTDARNKNIDAEIEEEIRLAWNKVYSDAYLNNYTPAQKANALKEELDKTGYTATRDNLTVTYRGKKILITETGEIKIKGAMKTITAGEKAPDDENAKYISGNYTAIIPAGFTVSDKSGESSIENGLVVTDGSENDWVWIPVSSEDLAKMYVEDSTGWTMLGTSVNTKLKTRSLTQAEETATGMILRLGTRALSRTNPGLTADPYYREPDVLSSYDTDQTYRTQAGFVEADGTTASSLETMATKLKDDYKNMIDSVRENGGFYIGRYELGKDSSNNPQIKAGTVMNNTNWYNLYKACKSFSNGNVESRIIWGCQWDQVCRFIQGNGANSIIDNSRSYGNYNDSTGDASTNSGSSNFNNTTGQLNSNWKIKNLYDIAGNCWEWTQEAYLTNRRACRGR